VSLSDDDEFDSLVVCVWRSENVYTYIYVYIYVYMYICIYIYTYISLSLTRLWCACGGLKNVYIHI